MSEMEVTEGQLLSQDFGVGGPPATVGDAPLQDSGKNARYPGGGNPHDQVADRQDGAQRIH